MKHELLSDPVMNAIVFEGRNKSYGAFALRDHYEKNMSLAMFSAVLFFLLCISSPYAFQYFKGSFDWKEESIIHPAINLDDFIRKSPEKLPVTVPRQTPPPMKPQIKFIPPAVLPDDKVPEDVLPPPVDSLRKISFGTTPIDSNSVQTGPGIYVDDPVIIYPGESIQKEPDIFPSYAVHQQPEFPEGMAAMYKFLIKHLEYPQLAKEIGLSGTVHVQFVVAKDGSIEKVTIVQGMGGGLDQEALRVVNLMPKWKPGKRNGQPVSAYFHLPVKFQML